MPQVKVDHPAHLRAYFAHGVDLRVNGDQAMGTCPFCGRPKFSVAVESGVWRCYVCNEGNANGKVVQGGNVLTFVRKLHELGGEVATSEADLRALAKERGLLSWKTLEVWGVVRSPITREWMLPGWSLSSGELMQLSRWVQCKDGRKPLATHGLKQELFFPQPMEDRNTIWVAEGSWDGMALWEALGCAKDTDDGIVPTSSDASLLSSNCVVAVPGCQTFNEAWLSFFAGKRVVVAYDSDHPKTVGDKTLPSAGWDGVRRVVGVLATAKEPPAEILAVRWGEDGYDPGLPSGHDLRDHFKAGKTVRERVNLLKDLLAKVEPAPEGWLSGMAKKSSNKSIEPMECKSFAEVVNAWRKAVSWSGKHGRCLEAVLSSMLAVSISTVQRGDQLFLMCLGAPGSLKTRMCDAMLVSKSCYPLEHLKGFHSGYRDSSGKDFSLLARIDRKTLITPEGDVLMSSPDFQSIMSQQRRIFDGTSGASYKNQAEDQRYTGLRTPWIIAGTRAMMDRDQSRLGDRFLKVFIDQPEEDEKDAILTRAYHAAMEEVRAESNCSVSSTVGGDLLTAYRLTGGYVDYLRANASRLINAVAQEDRSSDFKPMARFVADLRARPQLDPRKRHEENHDAAELPTRLVKQLPRLATCLAAVLNRTAIDDDVLKRVTKVAMDTAAGQTMALARFLRERDETGLTLEGVRSEFPSRAENAGRLLAFLKGIDVAMHVRVGPNNGLRWKLTERFRELWDRVTGDS